MTPLPDAKLGLAAFLTLAAPGTAVSLSGTARDVVARARAVVDRYAAGDAPIYGLNTGLGGNVGYRLQPGEVAAFQEQVIRGRCIGAGPPLPPAVSRAALLARILGAAKGGPGLTPSVVDALVAMFNAGVTPVVPARGSIGAGDLALCAHLVAPVIGRGEAWHGPTRVPGAAALAAAGLKPATLGPKDGLGLINCSVVSTAHAAVVLHDLAGLLTLAAATAALSFEGYWANQGVLDPRLAAARPGAGQAGAATWLRTLLAGGSVQPKLQDGLCFRTVAPVLGVVLASFDTAATATETELNARADNPLVLLEDGQLMSTPNFHTPAIALAFDTLAIALCQWATGSAYRVTKMMNPALSQLPKYLSPVGGASVGLNSLQKLAAALHAEIRLHATPASLDAIPVSDGVEDHAPHTHLAIRKLEAQLVPLRMLVAVEALTAAQAVHLRGTQPGNATLLDAIRARVPPLAEDRETGSDVDRVVELMDPALISRLRPAVPLATLDLLRLRP